MKRYSKISVIEEKDEYERRKLIYKG